jgi:toxin HigB-1
MIGSFKHKGLKRLYEEENPKGIRPDLIDRIRNLLVILDTAQTLSELEKIPSLRLHALKGDLKGYWAITVRANWRLIFKFENETATDVELIDYH